VEKRVRPTKNAPVSFFLREDAEWLAQPPGIPGLSHAGREVYDALVRNGARGGAFGKPPPETRRRTLGPGQLLRIRPFT
jgi:hypothetical protein